MYLSDMIAVGNLRNNRSYYGDEIVAVIMDICSFGLNSKCVDQTLISENKETKELMPLSWCYDLDIIKRFRNEYILGKTPIKNRNKYFLVFRDEEGANTPILAAIRDKLDITKKDQTEEVCCGYVEPPKVKED